MGPVAAAAVAVVTWLAKVAMVARVVMGVAREAVTVPRLDIPAETQTRRSTCFSIELRYEVSGLCLPVVPLTTSVVTVGLVMPGETSLTPPIGRVLRMVPGVPGAPFNTTWKPEGIRQSEPDFESLI